MNIAITERQQKILDYIRDHLDLHGYPPTIREIGRHEGISSTSVVNYHLNKLVTAGRISRAFGISRGLDLVDTVPVRIGDEIEATNLDGVPIGRVRFLAPAAKAA